VFNPIVLNGVLIVYGTYMTTRYLTAICRVGNYTCCVIKLCQNIDLDQLCPNRGQRAVCRSVEGFVRSV